MKVFLEDFPIDAVKEKAKQGSLRAIQILYDLKTKGYTILEDKPESEGELKFN